MVEAARLVLEAAGTPPLERFAHGTTVATNALLERKGARRHSSQPGASSTSCISAARTGRTSTASTSATRSRSSRWSAASAWTSA